MFPQVDVLIGSQCASQLLGQCLAAADALDDRVGVYLARFDEHARDRAARVDAKLAAGQPLAPLDGIPLGIKDILASAHGPTTAQSLVLDPAWGAAAGDAEVVRRLERAGAIVTCKITTMEFAVGLPDPDKPFPIPRSAWDTRRWAGGSSSGSVSGVSGSTVSASDYLQAQRVRRVAAARTSELLADVDLVVTATGRLGAPRLDAGWTRPDTWTPQGVSTTSADGTARARSNYRPRERAVPASRVGDGDHDDQRSPGQQRCVTQTQDNTRRAVGKVGMCQRAVGRHGDGRTNCRHGQSTERRGDDGDKRMDSAPAQQRDPGRRPLAPRANQAEGEQRRPPVKPRSRSTHRSRTPVRGRAVPARR
ncbi:amidase family protein [Nocardia yunnanensis]|uniref:amidase family protein n=1 Tax=Nocardia yunnanensis TaxID=2382165 RepID=UPI001CA39ABF|nr:amidase family protein [Nocardia yunnanensis]